MTLANATLFHAHMLVGAMFFTQGTWWAIGAWHAYYVRRNRKMYRVKRAYFVHPGIKPRCIEGLFKTACGLLATVLFGELLIREGLFKDGKVAQHLSISVFLCLDGVLDLLTYYGAPLPRGTDYVGLLMALSVEALLFYFHLYGRQKLDILLHTLLVFTVVLEIACVIIEMLRRRSVLVTLGRAFFAVLQGTWFCQIAFILYTQLPGTLPWEDNHQSSMVASAVFTWHAFGVLLYLALLGTFVSMCSPKCRDSGETESAHSSLLSAESAGVNSRCSVESVNTLTTIDSDNNSGA